MKLHRSLIKPRCRFENLSFYSYLYKTGKHIINFNHSTHMAKYIKQEMIDLSGKGEEKVYYRMKTKQNFDFKEFTKEVSRYNSMMNKGLLENVMSNVTDVLKRLLADGCSVTIDGLGTFKATIGLKDEKELDSFEGQDTKRNARSLRLTNVNFKADKNLIKEANNLCKLEREGESRLCHSPYSKEERLKMALDYLEKYGAMKVADYIKMTGLSRTKATLELQDFRHDPSSGITTIGRRSTLVYIKHVDETND